ncbi:sugar-binding domain-containing protein [Maribacter sp. LLG6340-A2]|uniref:sugar-binding domain-containing protein n=1 Tax=Maribacter sp. LLG6340-A2 TaxID=3160834 RepID=UPI003864CACC
MLCAFSFSIIYGQNHEPKNLAGEWSVILEKEIVIADNSGPINKQEGVIQLPGSLAEYGYGRKTTSASKGVLTPNYSFIGIANYKKTIHIPKTWKKKNVHLFLERVLWQSKVYVDGKLVSTKDALGTPHLHNLGMLSTGDHTLEIRVNNDMLYNIGDKGHAYSESTQTIWNGIVGEIKLIPQDPVYIEQLKTVSNIDDDNLKVILDIVSNKLQKSTIALRIERIGTNELIIEKEVKYTLNKGSNKNEVIFDLKGRLKKWSEFDPTVYTLKVLLTTKKYRDFKETEFGYLEVGHNGTHVTINKNPVFLRGNLDNVHFPLTGYPSTSLEEWLGIFKIYKDYGLNHVRFHSWCPPEAAFKAANRVGIYIQAEASVWIDSWMNEDMIAKGRPEMETRGHPKGLGYNAERDAWVKKEMNRVVDVYGNHPSFIMFCIGNELGSSDFDQVEKWIGKLKKQDSRRLYAGSTARKIMATDDYTVTHLIDNVGWTRGLNGAHTNWDFEKAYSQMNIPILAHEIGQWPVYPSWKEIEKYTGVLRAKNLNEFKLVAEKNGIADQDVQFQKATGALNQIMYKYEIESFLRTKSCAGIQLLSMQDYQGQGEALVGWLDVFYDSKGITAPSTFKQHHNETVPLLRTKKFNWKNTEIFQGQVEISHFGHEDLKNVELVYKITNNLGEKIYQNEIKLGDISRGTLAEAGKIEFPLSNITKATRLQIEVAIKNTTFLNHWNIWVFPETLEQPNTKVNIVDHLDDSILEALNNGENVLLVANSLGTQKNSVPFNFYQLYWSYTYFPGQGKTSLGLLVQQDHPALNNFPTSYYSDWQWEAFDKKGKAFILNELSKEYKPIVQLVDDFHRNNKEGLLFEFKVGKGKLLVSGFDINAKVSPVAKQLKYSLLNYMNSNEFMPTERIAEDFLIDNFFENPQGAGTENTLLKVNAGGLVNNNDTVKEWSSEWDDVQIKGEHVTYTVGSSVLKNNGKNSFWEGDNMVLDMQCPEGFLGSFYVLLTSGSADQASNLMAFEGRPKKVVVDNKKGKWVKFHVMREDSNDGKLRLKAKSLNGGKVSISEIRLEVE